MKHAHAHTNLLAETAMAVALSVALGNLRLLELPNGGSVGFGALPLLLLASVRGFRAAFLAGWCAGLAHALAGGTIVHPAQLLLDYGLAYAVLAVAAVGSTDSVRSLRVAAALGCAAQYCVFVVSGAIFFAQYAPGSPWAFSMGYNAITAAPEALLAVWLLPLFARAHRRVNPPRERGTRMLPPRVLPPFPPMPAASVAKQQLAGAQRSWPPASTGFLTGRSAPLGARTPD